MPADYCIHHCYGITQTLHQVMKPVIHLQQLAWGMHCEIFQMFAVISLVCLCLPPALPAPGQQYNLFGDLENLGLVGGAAGPRETRRLQEGARRARVVSYCFGCMCSLQSRTAGHPGRAGAAPVPGGKRR